MQNRVNTVQPKDNNGALFHNIRKAKETHPDYTGEAMIGGVEYRISGWARESKGGVKYLSLAFTRKDQVGQFRRADKAPVTRQPGEDDEKLPF
ncbi:MAG: hypothetical protein HRJ53_25060 [Acidobacteria bacterium Pan2503]|uniref:DUF736 domain-containing protein n=1 Tax=Candidatus Acidiferrum panamense TaxID=2741543 RepID=A0A7V8NVL9_9BACT|nr:hypothetical protein [Candidatus Acidoferrum panamensis]